MFNIEEINFIWKTAITSACLFFHDLNSTLGHLIQLKVE